MFLPHKDLGGYTLGEILFDKVCKLHPSRWEKPLSSDREVTMRCPLMRACDWTMLRIHPCNQVPLGFILGARMERQCPFTCLRMV